MLLKLPPHAHGSRPTTIFVVLTDFCFNKNILQYCAQAVYETITPKSQTHHTSPRHSINAEQGA